MTRWFLLCLAWGSIYWIPTLPKPGHWAYPFLHGDGPMFFVIAATLSMVASALYLSIQQDRTAALLCCVEVLIILLNLVCLIQYLTGIVGVVFQHYGGFVHLFAVTQILILLARFPCGIRGMAELLRRGIHRWRGAVRSHFMDRKGGNAK